MPLTSAHGSIRLRIFLYLLAFLLPCTVALVVDSYHDARRRTDAVFDRALVGSALAIADRVVVDDGGRLQVDLPYIALEMLTSGADDRVFYRVHAGTGETVTGYADLPEPSVVPGLGDAPVAFDGTYRGMPIRGIALASAAADAWRSIGFVVVVAETTEGRVQQASAFTGRSALRILALVAATVMIAWFVVGRGIRPLERLVAAVGTRSPDDLSPISAAAPREVVGLVDSINGLMDRLEVALSSLKRFAGNAGHQLRTPLSVVLAHIELARRAEDRRQAAAMLETAKRAAQEAEGLVGHFLLMARLEVGKAQAEPPQPVDLGGLAERTTRERAPAALQAGLELAFEPETAGATVRVNPTLIRELLLNLINNAIAHAAPGRAVVRVSRDAASVVLEVEDDGPGLGSPAPVDLTAAGPDDGGTGIGLRVCAEIAAHFGGRLSLGAARTGRGLRASLALPAMDGAVG